MTGAEWTAAGRKLGFDKPGSATLLRRVRPGALGLTMAKHGWLAAMLFGPPLIWAVVDQAWSFVLALALSIAVGILPGALTWKKELPKDLRQVEAMCALALLFAGSAVLSIPAFMALDMPPLHALFEGTSAITTTGLSLAADPDSWPMSAHFLRAWMQWCGGLAMATAVLALLVSPGGGAYRMGKAGIDEGDRISNTRSQARQLLAVYGGLTLVCMLPILLTIPDWREAVALTLSAVSTGGFAPRSDSLASYSILGQTLVIFACIAGAISLLTWGLIARGDWRGALGLRSLQRVLAVCFLAGAAYGGWLWLAGSSGIWGEILNILSGLTTAGYSTGAMPVTPALLVLFVLFMLFGADSGSTGGGLKLNRFGIVIRAVRYGLTRPRLPDSAVAPLRARGKPVEPETLVAILALTGLYAATLLVLWVALMAIGAPPIEALFDTVSALSTVGLSTGVVSTELPDWLIAGFTFAMWLGRLEFIAVLLLFLPRTWITNNG